MEQSAMECSTSMVVCMYRRDDVLLLWDNFTAPWASVKSFEGVAGKPVGALLLLSHHTSYHLQVPRAFLVTLPVVTMEQKVIMTSPHLVSIVLNSGRASCFLRNKTMDEISMILYDS